MNIAAIETTLYTWIKDELDGVVAADRIVFRQGSAPLPPRPCVALQMLNGPMRTGSFDDQTYDTTNDILDVSGQRTMDYSIQVFGNPASGPTIAKQIGADLSTSLTKPSVLDKLRAGGVAIFNIENIKDIPTLKETEYEERVQFDIKIGVPENVQDDTGCFETVDVITGTYPNNPDI